MVYWMQRAQRAVDNPALEVAVRSANDVGKPVVVFFALLKTHPIANLRHYTFMMEGLIDTAERLERRGNRTRDSGERESGRGVSEVLPVKYDRACGY